MICIDIERIATLLYVYDDISINSRNGTMEWNYGMEQAYRPLSVVIILGAFDYLYNVVLNAA